MHKSTAVLNIVAGLFFSTVVLAAPAGQEDAVAAGQKWLTVVDNGDYAASYDTSSSLFRGTLTKDQWVASLKGARAIFGKVLSRKVNASNSATSLPGAPDGEYVVIQLETAFEHKSAASETLTLKRDTDGQWRMAGYYIR